MFNNNPIFSFITKRGNFLFHVLVNTVAIDTEGKTRPTIKVKFLKYKGNSLLIGIFLNKYRNLVKVAYFHPDDKIFSVSYGLNLAIDRLTRDIEGILSEEVGHVIDTMNAELDSLEEATKRSRKRFIKNFTDPKRIQRRFEKTQTQDPEGIRELVTQTEALLNNNKLTV